ncbi:hypothetical protein [Chryseobacterium sp.]|uniref:TRADD-N-associated membrane domain-containing protein n=1 Tax=Chryseobacterium sp. TaxID=1871047 RepID=UPI00333E482A
MELDLLIKLSTLIFTSLAGVFGTYFLKTKIDNKSARNEDIEINLEVEKYVKLIDDGDKDVLALMIKNVAELREYYVINKQQARNSFSSALIICILGFILFAGGLIISYIIPEKQDVIPYTTIGGAIVEIIAGLFFWLYSKAIKQINIFHTSLQSTEKFLTAIQLVEKISVEKRDDAYTNIIEKIISFNFTQTRDIKSNNG